MATNKSASSDNKAQPEAKKKDSAEETKEIVVKDSTQGIDESPQAEEPAGEDLKTAMAGAESSDEAQPTSKPAKRGKHSKKKVVLLISGAVVAVLGILFAIPLTRYAILGTFIARDVTFSVVDSKTNKPVSGVHVAIAGKSATSDAQGKATVKAVPVGSKSVTATKKYHQNLSTTVLVPVFDRKDANQLNIVATGRQVPVTILNKLSGKPVERAVVTVDGSSSTTDTKGEVTLGLPAYKPTQQASIKLDGYHATDVTVQVTEQRDERNTFTLVPSGTLYFLSKRTGKINVMKSNIDGSNAQIVVAGTGKEDDRETVMLASRDWKYLALKARRDSERPKLYLIDTASGKLSVIDEGDVDFTPIGWHDHNFIYKLHRTKYNAWQSKQFALKSFNAHSSSLSVLDETDAVGSDANNYGYESLHYAYILDNQIVYTKDWNASASSVISGKNITINSIKPDGSSKKVVKSFATGQGNYVNDVKSYKPQELYFSIQQNYKDTFWEYEDSTLTEQKDFKRDDFYKFYPTYLLSPSGKNTFWYDQRDGKNTLFVGDADGNNGKEIVSLSEFTPYGWLGEDYLLVSKNGSELYVISRANPAAPLKITDYHKPQVNFAGYGYGYGGF